MITDGYAVVVVACQPRISVKSASSGEAAPGEEVENDRRQNNADRYRVGIRRGAHAGDFTHWVTIDAGAHVEQVVTPA